MENEVIFTLIEKLLEDNKFSSLKDVFKEMNTVDIASVISEADSEKQAKIFRLLPKDLSADVFAYLDSDTQETVVNSITNAEIHNIFEDMFIDDAVDFLEEVPANLVTRVLAQTSKETRDLINRFLRYPEDSAGSIMTVEMAAFHEDMTVEQAIESLRKTAQEKEAIDTCYCIDSNRHLTGILPLKKLIIAKSGSLMSDIMISDEKVISVNTLDDRETVARLVRKYDLLSIPVVDNENRLVGIITIDDIVDVIQEENTEDFEKMALLLPSEDDYLKTGVFTLTKNRIVWLLILMISATFTGRIIEGFEDKLAAISGLTACIPMLMDTGGNAGNQVSTLIIRGLALGNIKIKDYFRVLWKEIRVAFICGIVLAVANFGRMLLIRLVTGGDTTTPVIIVVCLAMVCAVILAKVMGCTLPILAKVLHLDPALMAGPMITTIVDACTLLIYFAIASAVLKM